MTSTRNVSIADVLPLLDEALAERGTDYTYPARDWEPASRLVPERVMCRYWHSEDNGPGCIVGVVLHKLGVLPQVLEAFDNMTHPICSDYANNGQPAAEQLDKMDLETADGSIRINYHAARVLQFAQSAQDVGKSWDVAVSRAHTEGAQRTRIFASEV